jgi:hypothetical protein
MVYQERERERERERGGHEGPSGRKNWRHEGPKKIIIIWSCPHAFYIKKREIQKRSLSFFIIHLPYMHSLDQTCMTCHLHGSNV